MRKKITLFAITVLFFAFTFAQTNIDIANAIQVEELPFTDVNVDPTNGAQEENQINCNFNLPSLDYKFEVVTGGTVTITMATPAGASEPVLYRGASLNETDVTLLTVYDNVGADGTGCFDNDPGLDGTRTATVVAGDFFYVFCANVGPTDIVFTGDAVFASAGVVAPECGGNYFDTGGTADGYSASEDVTTTIMPDNAGDVVTVTFTYVDIEAATTATDIQDGCWDFLTVYDGPDTSSPVLAQTLCGEESGDGDVPFVPESELNIGDSFTSTHASGALTFVFTSDSSVQETGWEADVTCAPPSASVSDLEALGFNYYPNPVSNDLFLTARENITNVAIFNMLGQEVKNASPSSLETTISMSNLATGTYFVKAQIGDAVGTFKVIKK